jgi:hypothetical protein
MPPGSQQGALGAIRTLLPRPTWLDVLVRIVRLEPGQAERMRPRIAEPDRRVPGELVSAVGHGEIDTGKRPGHAPFGLRGGHAVIGRGPGHGEFLICMQQASAPSW